MSARQPLQLVAGDWDEINESMDQLQAEAYAAGRASVGSADPDWSDRCDEAREGVRAAILQTFPIIGS